jgi:serine/threonine-protein kinase RsbT
MQVIRAETLPILTDQDVVLSRQAVRRACVEVGFSLVDQTKMVTAASELARNALVHGGGGSMRLEVLQNGGRDGLRLVFADEGPGIPDIEQALTDHWTSGGGLGLGLGGSRRLVNEFDLQSAPGQGTTVTVARWR